MEILFGNKGIYHYMDAKVGTMQELEEHGRMYQVRMLVENELPYILPSSMICTDAEVWLSHNTKDCYGLQAYLQQKTMNGTQSIRISFFSFCMNKYSTRITRSDASSKYASNASACCMI